jgi:hypothetical protein
MDMPALTLLVTETLIFLGTVALVWVMLDILGGGHLVDGER